MEVNYKLRQYVRDELKRGFKVFKGHGGLPWPEDDVRSKLFAEYRDRFRRALMERPKNGEGNWRNVTEIRADHAACVIIDEVEQFVASTAQPKASDVKAELTDLADKAAAIVTALEALSERGRRALGEALAIDLENRAFNKLKIITYSDEEAYQRLRGTLEECGERLGDVAQTYKPRKRKNSDPRFVELVQRTASVWYWTTGFWPPTSAIIARPLLATGLGFVRTCTGCWSIW